MESSDNFNFSLFRPRNLHGRKNRNVILTFIAIWAVAVFGFQFLLRAIEKPVPEATLTAFNEVWPAAVTGNLNADEGKVLLNSLIVARGKVTLTAAEQQTLAGGISASTYSLLPDSVGAAISSRVEAIAGMRTSLAELKGDDYLEMKKKISAASQDMIEIASPYTSVMYGSLEGSIFAYSLGSDRGKSLNDPTLSGIPAIMALYMTHNQSVLTDSKILGFPLHYFYTAVFLLILFVALCIAYNIIIEWRLNKEGITE
jgi:uncharacterized membrane protein